MSMIINFGRVRFYNEKFPSIKSPDLCITWSCKITETILAAASLQLQGLWTVILARW